MPQKAVPFSRNTYKNLGLPTKGVNLAPLRFVNGETTDGDPVRGLFAISQFTGGNGLSAESGPKLK
jgi:hypothetical protein